jgi:hypothetical protein
MTTPGHEPDRDRNAGLGGWVAVLVAICVLWLAAMVAASYFGLENKSPVRIENWRLAPPAPLIQWR